MRRMLGSLFILCVVGSQAHAQKTVRYSGTVVSCWQGKLVSAKGFDVLLYSSREHPEVIAQLKQLEELGKKLQNSQSQEDVDAADVAYGKLEQMVKSTKAKVPHTKSAEGGLFRLAPVAADSNEWIVLAINLGVEDDLSAYGYEIATIQRAKGIEIAIGAHDCVPSR